MRAHMSGISAKLFVERQLSGVEPHWTSVYGDDLYVEVQNHEDDEEYTPMKIVQLLRSKRAFLVFADYTIQDKYSNEFGFEDDGGAILVVVPAAECGSILRANIVNRK